METHAWKPGRNGAVGRVLSEGAHDAHEAVDQKLRRMSAKLYVSQVMAAGPKVRMDMAVERSPAVPSRYPVTHLLRRSWNRITRILAGRRERDA